MNYVTKEVWHGKLPLQACKSEGVGQLCSHRPSHELTILLTDKYLQSCTCSLVPLLNCKGIGPKKESEPHSEYQQCHLANKESPPEGKHKLCSFFQKLFPEMCHMASCGSIKELSLLTIISISDVINLG